MRSATSRAFEHRRRGPVMANDPNPHRGPEALILGGPAWLVQAVGRITRMDRDGRGTRMTEQELMPIVLRARDGDRTAYGELVERFQSTVYAVALARLRNPTEAQELAQEVFLHAMRKLPQLREVQCFGGWLRQIPERM